MERTLERRFKPKDDITVVSGSNFLIGKPGVVVKVLERPPEGETGTIVVDFPEMPVHMFNYSSRLDIPEHQKKWCCFEPENLVLGRKPLTFEEQLEAELKKFGGMAPVQYHVFDPREDGLCMVDGCQNFASEILWFNTWGTGYRLHVCRWHREDHNPFTCCDELPFELKKADAKAA